MFGDLKRFIGFRAPVPQYLFGINSHSIAQQTLPAFPFCGIRYRIFVRWTIIRFLIFQISSLKSGWIFMLSINRINYTYDSWCRRSQAFFILTGFTGFYRIFLFTAEARRTQRLILPQTPADCRRHFLFWQDLQDFTGYFYSSQRCRGRWEI